MNRKQRRAAKKQMSKETSARMEKLKVDIARAPTTCDECGKEFDNKNQKMLDSWKIAIYDDGPINLVCGDCVANDVKSVP